MIRVRIILKTENHSEYFPINCYVINVNCLWGNRKYIIINHVIRRFGRLISRRLLNLLPQLDSLYKYLSFVRFNNFVWIYFSLIFFPGFLFSTFTFTQQNKKNEVNKRKCIINMGWAVNTGPYHICMQQRKRFELAAWLNWTELNWNSTELCTK